MFVAWLVAVLMPFILLGAWQAWSKENVTKTKLLYREMRLSRTLLIRNARIAHDTVMGISAWVSGSKGWGNEL